MTKVGLALEAIQQLQERQPRQEELVEHTAAGGWTEDKEEVWVLYQDDELMAEVAKIPNRAAYAAIIWPFHSGVEWNTHISVLDAMRWCEERLRAATLNARVDEAMAGDADEDFDHKQCLEELANAKTDHDTSTRAPRPPRTGRGTRRTEEWHGTTK